MSTVQVTAYDTATTYKVTIGNVVVSVLGQGGTVNTTATALKNALAASTDGMFSEVTWTVATDTVTGTGPTSGKPFTATSSVSGGTGTIGAVTTTTTATGPNDFNTTQNWSANTVPVAGDTIVFDGSSSADLLYNLNQTTTAFAAVVITAAYTGKIGLAEVNIDNTSYPYPEYRTAYLTSGTALITVGAGSGTGLRRGKFSNGSVACTLTVYGTGTAVDTGNETVLFKGTSASNVVYHYAGSLGIAVLGGETANVSGGFTVGTPGVASSKCSCRCGSGVTVGTANVEGGKLELNGAATVVNVLGGADSTAVVVLNGTGAIGTLNARGGTTYLNTSGGVGTALAVANATVDLTQDQRSKTITPTIQMYGGGKWLDPLFTATYGGTPDMTLNQAGLTLDGKTGIFVNVGPANRGLVFS